MGKDCAAEQELNRPPLVDITMASMSTAVRSIGLSVWIGCAFLYPATMAACGQAPTAPSTTPQPATWSTLRGHVLAHDGQPLAHGHARLNVPGHDDVTVEFAADGAFELSSPISGLAWLDLSGVGHRPSRLAVLLDDAPQSLDVRLGTNRYRADFGELRLRVSTAKHERFFRARPRPDGRYEVVLHGIEGPAELSWTSALAGCCGETAAGRDGRAIEASQWTPDGAGQYRWKENLSGAQTRIAFNPRRLPPPELPMSVRFADEHGLLAEVAAIEAEASSVQRAYHDAILARAEHADGAVRRFAIEYPWAQHAESLAVRAEAQADPRLRRVAWAAYFARPASAVPTDAEQARAARAMRDIPPDDAAWSWGHVATALRAAGETDAARAYSVQVLERHPDPEVVSEVLWLLSLIHI